MLPGSRSSRHAFVHSLIAANSRLLAAAKPKMLIPGALLRKLVTIAYGVLKSGKSFDPALHA
jgi:hypothetical protein